MTIKKIIKYGDSEGFTYTHEPIEDSITIKETEVGYAVGYLVRDNDASPLDEISDDKELFLVNYHRDFTVKKDDIITKDDVVEWYRNKPIPQSKDYHMFPLSMYSHSGVVLSLGSGSHFPDARWDVSHVGVVLVSKKEWPDRDKAAQVAKGLIETWNQYLSGDVYGVVVETFNKEKENTEEVDSCWGYYGNKYAMEELKSTMENYK